MQEANPTAQCSKARAIRRTALGILGAIAVLATTVATLAQGGLYGPEAPRDVAYLRVVNAAADAVATGLDGEPWTELGFAEASRYTPVPPGTHVVAAGEGSVEVEVAPESFTTVVALPGEILVLADTPLRDISRGLLTLYNLTTEDAIDLTTRDGTAVFTGVPPRSSRSLSISEAEVAFVVNSGAETLAALDSRLYRRGEAHALIVLPRGAEPRVVYVRAEAER